MSLEREKERKSGRGEGRVEEKRFYRDMVFTNIIDLLCSLLSVLRSNSMLKSIKMG